MRREARAPVARRSSLTDFRFPAGGPGGRAVVPAGLRGSTTAATSPLHHPVPAPPRKPAPPNLPRPPTASAPRHSRTNAPPLRRQPRRHARPRRGPGRAPWWTRRDRGPGTAPERGPEPVGRHFPAGGQETWWKTTNDPGSLDERMRGTGVADSEMRAVGWAQSFLMSQGARAGRRWAREHLDSLEWAQNAPDLVDSVLLTVTELITNAHKHAHSDAQLVLTWDSTCLHVSVHDASPWLCRWRGAAVLWQFGRRFPDRVSMASDSSSMPTGETPSAAPPRPGTKALATGAGGGRRLAVAECRRVPPVLVDIEIRAQRAPSEAVDNCCRVTSTEPAPRPSCRGRANEWGSREPFPT